MGLLRRAWRGVALVVVMVGSGLAVPLGATPLPPFTLSNWDGRPVTRETLRGHRTILVFTYAKCVVGCPTVTFQLKGLDEELGHPADLCFVLVTVNPTVDTPEEILRHFRTCDIDPRQDPRWLFLGGTPAQVARVLDAYGIEVRHEPTPLGDMIRHTIKVVVADRAGEIVTTFHSYHWDPEEMRHALGL